MLDRIPTHADFAAGQVTDPSRSEVIRQRLYDWQLYPTAGVTNLSYFSLPIGQGQQTAPVPTAGQPKTIHDTNMVIPNALPSGLSFIIETIEVHFLPGSVSTANTYTPATMQAFNTTASVTVFKSIDDLNLILQSGTLTLNILAKNYVQEHPLYTFPPKTYFDGFLSAASNSATTAEVAMGTIHAAGRPYIVDPTITLKPAVNFGVNISWPAVVATPSGFNGRMGVIFDGYMQRAGQ